MSLATFLLRYDFKTNFPLTWGGASDGPSSATRLAVPIDENDPRHRDNGGGAAQPKVTVVNTLDPDELVSKAFGSGRSDQTILNRMRSNSGAVKQALR